eukprot:707153_1
MMSTSNFSMSNLARSGLKVMCVQSGPANDVITDLARELMLRENTCLKWFLRFPSPVSTINSVEKTLASLAPYPLRPPVVFRSESVQIGKSNESDTATVQCNSD